ncbi:MAG: acetyl-CoA carboxylase carboxyltransferase subunit alpha [Clostridiales bacterium]|nr:acetyl-CoA carboxylase carboxyltransferase subunit alpha [Clostridiales bacterium]
MTIYEKIQYTRSGKRPTAVAYIDALFHDFVQLHGDRRFGDDSAVISGIAMLGDTPVTVIGIEKGTDTKDKIQHNFGQANPEGYRKALRLMRQAEKFHRPVITLVDTAGASCGIGAEERGQGSAIAENLYEMMTLKTPILSMVIGEGGSGGALALAVADTVWMLENAYYSVVSPEGCASILWKDSAKAAEAAQALKPDAQSLYDLGIIERVVPEPEDFSDATEKQTFFQALQKDLSDEICLLQSKQTDELLSERYEKFRKVGAYDRNHH